MGWVLYVLSLKEASITAWVKVAIELFSILTPLKASVKESLTVFLFVNVNVTSRLNLCGLYVR